MTKKSPLMYKTKAISKEDEIKNCYFVKVILMICIVFYHTILFWEGNWFTVITPVKEVPAFLYVAKWLNSFHIYTFTFVSGYLFYYVKFEHGGYPSFRVFIEKKIQRLLIPYVVFSVVWVGPIGWAFFKYDLMEIVKKYVLDESPSQLWFLLMLFWGLILLYLLSGIIRKSIVWAVVVSAFCFGFGLVLSRFVPNVFQIWTAFKYIPFLALGFVARQYDFGKIRRIPCLVWLALNIALLFISEYLSEKGSIYSYIRIITAFLSSVFGALWAFTFLQKIAVFFDVSDRKWVRFFAQNSMTVFLIHQQLVYVMLFLLNGFLPPVVLGMLIFIVVLTVSLMISSLLQHFRITRFLTGGKL